MDKIKRGPLPTNDEVILLRPGQLIGKMFGLKRVTGSHVLKKGHYNVKAGYHNEFGLDQGVFGKALMSNEVTVEIR